MEFIIDEVKCRECPLWETSYTDQVRRAGFYGRGTGKNGLWFYGEAYGANEILQGMPFVGDAGNILSSILREIGVEERDCYICNFNFSTASTAKNVRGVYFISPRLLDPNKY